MLAPVQVSRLYSCRLPKGKIQGEEAMSDQTSESLLYLNGINGATGEPTPPVSADIVARVLRGETIEPHHLGVLQRKKREKEATLGPVEGIDPQDLAQTGWGVIFAFEDERIPAIREALKELLDLRKEQAGPLYREFTGPDAYRPGESKMAFLKRHDVVPGAVDPKRGVPYYLLIVGNPATIPYTFQYQLDVQFAVGRIWFDTLDEYASYARSVVAAEKGEISLPRTAAFFGTQNPDDRPTELSATKLVAPLAEHVASEQQAWNIQTLLKEQATKASLINLMGGNGGNETPTFLFSASHGLYLPNGHENQFAHQGALVCQDWPGRQDHQGPLPQDYYLAGDDLEANARLMGQIAFFFACFGAGTPKIDDFWQRAGGNAERATLAPHSFLSHLPQRMLGHPKGGALAVVGHVDRAWSYSFAWGHQETIQLTTFESTLRRLMGGGRIGSAIEYFNERYAEIASDLHTRNSGILQQIEYGKQVGDRDLAELWVMTNDSRNYVVMGDPAVRLPVGSGPTPTERPTIPEISSIPTSPAPDAEKNLGPTGNASNKDNEAQNIATAPQAITPNPDGTLTLHWHETGDTLTLSVATVAALREFFRSGGEGREEEGQRERPQTIGGL